MHRMSHANVERVIGRLATDEALRRRFELDPEAVLDELTIAGGLELSACERHALAGLDPDRLAEFAEALDARIQKADLCGGEA
jgi:hypothetical protein